MPRQDDRITYLNEVLLEWSSGMRDARVTDLSVGGCYVDTIATLPVGENISFTLRIADGRLLFLSGEVAHVVPNFGFGVRFTNLSEEAIVILQRLILDAH